MSYYYSPTSSAASSFSSRSYAGSSSSNSGSAGAPVSSTTSASLSRPASVSPQFSNAYTFYTASRLRFQASRGFDVEDDMEFCPALVDHDQPRAQTHYFNHHHYQQQQQHTPESSPIMRNSGLTSDSSTSPLNRTRKVIEIVDPTTGLKVAAMK